MSFYGMQRANGDWFAIDDKGQLSMPIFKSSGEAMIGRSYDVGMECFRPVAFDTRALEGVKRTDGATASFLIVSDPSRHAKHGFRLGFSELASLMTDFEKVEPNRDINNTNSTR